MLHLSGIRNEDWHCVLWPKNTEMKMKGIALVRKYTDVIISRSPPSWSHTARRPPSPPSWPPSPPPPPPLHWRSSSSVGGQGKQLLGGINFKAVIICDSYATVDFVISRTSPPPPLKWSSLKRKKLVRKSFKLDLVLKPHPVDFDFLTVSYISSFHLNGLPFGLVFIFYKFKFRSLLDRV